MAANSIKDDLNVHDRSELSSCWEFCKHNRLLAVKYIFDKVTPVIEIKKKYIIADLMKKLLFVPILILFLLIMLMLMSQPL